MHGLLASSSALSTFLQFSSDLNLLAVARDSDSFVNYDDTPDPLQTKTSYWCYIIFLLGCGIDHN